MSEVKETIDSSAASALRSFITRIERLETEKKALSDDIKEVYAEAKGNGFDTKIMKQIVKLRKMEDTEIQEQDALLDMYRRALGITVEARTEDDAA